MLLRFRHKTRREGGALAEEILFHVFGNELLGFLLERQRRYSLRIIFICSSHIVQAS